VLALIYLQAWSVLLCMHIYIRMLRGVNTAYGVKGCVSNTVCVIIVMHVVTWFYANTCVRALKISYIFGFWGVKLYLSQFFTLFYC